MRILSLLCLSFLVPLTAGAQSIDDQLTEITRIDESLKVDEMRKDKAIKKSVSAAKTAFDKCLERAQYNMFEDTSEEEQRYACQSESIQKFERVYLENIIDNNSMTVEMLSSMLGTIYRFKLTSRGSSNGAKGLKTLSLECRVSNFGVDNTAITIGHSTNAFRDYVLKEDATISTVSRLDGEKGVSTEWKVYDGSTASKSQSTGLDNRALLRLKREGLSEAEARKKADKFDETSSAPNDPVNWMKALLGHKGLTLKTQRPALGDEVSRFNLAGVDIAISRIAKRCGWDDKLSL